jgi:hypothetical protein
VTGAITPAQLAQLAELHRRTGEPPPDDWTVNIQTVHAAFELATGRVITDPEVRDVQGHVPYPIAIAVLQDLVDDELGEFFDRLLELLEGAAR